MQLGYTRWLDLIDDPGVEFAIPNIPRPEYLAPMTDPVFGTTVTRITGDPGTTIGTAIGTWGTVARHWYSKVQPWNADEGLIYLYHNIDGSPTNSLLLHGESYEPVKAISPPTARVRWHPTDPDLMIYARGTDIGYYNVQTEQAQTLCQLSGYNMTLGFLGEGSPSADGSMMAVYAEVSGNKKCFAYNLETDIKYPELDVDSFQLNSQTYTCLDWVTISPSGQYVIIYWTNVFIEIYDLNMQLVSQIEWPFGHADVGYNAAGEEIIVGQSANWYVCHNGQDLVTSPLKGQLAAANLSDGAAIQLDYGDDYAISHTSARNLDRLGWTYNWVKWGTMRDEIVAYTTDGRYSVRRFCHLHNQEVDYYSEAHPCPSPDGTRVLFASNWNGANGRPMSTYVVDARR